MEHTWSFLEHTRADDHIMALRLSLPPRPKDTTKLRMPVIMKLRKDAIYGNGVEDKENLIPSRRMRELEECMLAYTNEIKINMRQHLEGYWTISDMKHSRKLSREIKDNDDERVFDPDTAMIDVAINEMMQYFGLESVTSCCYRDNDEDDETKESDEEDMMLHEVIARDVHSFCRAWSQMTVRMSRVNKEVNCKAECESTKDLSLRDPTPILPLWWMKRHIVPQSEANKMVYDGQLFASGFFIAQERLEVGKIKTSIRYGGPNGVECLSRQSDDFVLTPKIIVELMEIAKLKYQKLQLELKSLALTQEIEKLEKEFVGGKSKKEKTRVTSPY